MNSNSTKCKELIMYKKRHTAEAYSSILGIPQTRQQPFQVSHFSRTANSAVTLKKSYVKLINACMSSDASKKEDVAKQKQTIYSLPQFYLISLMLYLYEASEAELTIAPQFLDQCFKCRYISKKLEIGELLKVQDHRICRKVSSIPIQLTK